MTAAKLAVLLQRELAGRLVMEEMIIPPLAFAAGHGYMFTRHCSLRLNLYTRISLPGRATALRLGKLIRVLNV